MSQRDVIWSAGLDDDKYACKVERVNASEGQLIVQETKTGKVVLSQNVGLSYGAMFGPDYADVATWMSTIEKAIPAGTST